MQGQADTYKEIKTFEHPNAIVRVYVPDLTKEERSRRMKAVHKAAAELLKSKSKE
jgi:ribosome recycling factor